MTTKESLSGLSQPEALLWRHHEVLWHYTQRRKEAEEFMAAHAAIDAINANLSRDTHRLVAESNYRAPTTVYERDEERGGYGVRSTIFTEGAGYRFIGDRLEVIDGVLVLVDTELGGGINVDGVVHLESLDELNGRRRFEDYAALLNMIAETAPGEEAVFDCMYY